MEEGKKNIFSRIAGNIAEGDKVIWIVTLILIMFSMVSIFSSTSLMAKGDQTRTVIFCKHLIVAVAGAAVIIGISAIPGIAFFRRISRFGFLASFILLLMLICRVKIGSFISVPYMNGVCRGIRVGGFTIQVYEVVKIAMVMYLAWAVQAYENGSFRIADILGTKWPKAFGWIKSARGQRWAFIFGPMFIVVLMIMKGSTGSAFLCGLVMIVTILVGGMKYRDLIDPMVAGIAGVAVILFLHVVSSGAIMDRLQTAFNRMKIELPYPNPEARASQREAISLTRSDPSDLREGSKEFYEYLDKIKQPESAEIAIVQGGRLPLGKGPGKSTQRYVVPVMYEDYMFSLIVEEYGLLIGFFVIILYLSLFARGNIMVRNSKNRYAKACIGGLVFLITFQAMFHIIVNCNIGLLTGQTLPLISHGRCSFLCFCFALGVILSVSTSLNKKIKEERRKTQVELNEIINQNTENESNN